ncbi:uncharacterized protein J7T54_008305 [Emericellopsis cladophorae]|uniref:Uncharacterized protein n=1 Tax=Emericellopsis cladophorae TaxID=2686198 RepID=A0A9Q0B931_9HYPO|nr:uncharacterized protein J7T54_008305 [Emericellopsis cladophorae]KAI6777667.1 hypothetical protein J7T54_008305 [Emericellopsis cladophorae]
MEPVQIIAGLRVTYHLVLFGIDIAQVPDGVRYCLGLIRTCYQDVQHLIELRQTYLALLEKRPLVLERVNNIISTATDSLREVCAIVEKCRPDPGKSRISFLDRMAWVLNDEKTIKAQEPMLSRQHATVLAELNFLRNIALMAPVGPGENKSEPKPTKFIDNLALLGGLMGRSDDHSLPGPSRAATWSTSTSGHIPGANSNNMTDGADAPPPPYCPSVTSGARPPPVTYPPAHRTTTHTPPHQPNKPTWSLPHQPASMPPHQAARYPTHPQKATPYPPQSQMTTPYPTPAQETVSSSPMQTSTYSAAPQVPAYGSSPSQTPTQQGIDATARASLPLHTQGRVPPATPTPAITRGGTIRSRDEGGFRAIFGDAVLANPPVSRAPSMLQPMPTGSSAVSVLSSTMSTAGYYAASPAQFPTVTTGVPAPVLSPMTTGSSILRPRSPMTQMSPPGGGAGAAYMQPSGKGTASAGWGMYSPMPGPLNPAFAATDPNAQAHGPAELPGMNMYAEPKFGSHFGAVELPATNFRSEPCRPSHLGAAELP